MNDAEELFMISACTRKGVANDLNEFLAERDYQFTPFLTNDDRLTTSLLTKYAAHLGNALSVCDDEEMQEEANENSLGWLTEQLGLQPPTAKSPVVLANELLIENSYRLTPNDARKLVSEIAIIAFDESRGRFLRIYQIIDLLNAILVNEVE